MQKIREINFEFWQKKLSKKSAIQLYYTQHIVSLAKINVSYIFFECSESEGVIGGCDENDVDFCKHLRPNTFEISNFKLKLHIFPLLERWNLKSEELN